MPNFVHPLKRILLFTASFLFSWMVSAQDLEQTYLSGKSNFALGNYQAATIDLERVLFFGAGKYDTEVFELLGKIHQNTGDFDRSASFFSQAADNAELAEDFLRNKIAQSSCLILANKAVLAKIELLGLSEDIPDSIQAKQYFLLGVSEFTSGTFDESRKAFKRAISINNPSKSYRIDSLFDALAKIKHPNPKMARFLSAVVPGSGQFYSGDVKNGLNSLLLTGGFITVGALVATNYTLLDSFVSVIPWIQRYYIGGIKRAGIIAKDRKLEKQDEIYQNILGSFNKL
jgi:tetratricopeptide (TPR) repeat protein